MNTVQAGEKSTAVLMANGDFSPAALPYLQTLLEAGAILVGVDGGARRLRSFGFVPDYVTGDFDSLTEAERIDLAERGARIIPTPDQDFTDLDKALAFVTETLGIQTVRVFGASAGRLDHVYSNLSALLKYGKAGEVRLVDEWGETRPVPHPLTLSGDDLPGRTLSLIALGPVHGVTTTGVEWPLSSETLAPGVRDGTLNRVTARTVTVEAKSGDLLLMLHHATVPIEPLAD